MAEHEEHRDEETNEQELEEQSHEEQQSDNPEDKVKAIEDDPAYSPENEMLKDIKGG